MKGLSGRGYKGGDDLATTVEGEPVFNTPRDCNIITLQSIKKHWYKALHQSQEAVV